MGPPANITAKKSKLFNSRTIRTDFVDPNFKDGKLSVSEFLSSRQFEIQSLEKAKLRAKFANSNRCFQSLPRTLRRRTASHNVKRIPKRLRNRAIKEMQNSSNGVPPKPKLPRGRALYKLKMATKLLKLASRIKELRGYVDTRDLKIRLQIKLLTKQKRALQSLEKAPTFNNSMGSYDNTGIGKLASIPSGNIKYTKRQKQYVWLPTHIWHTKRAHLIKQHGYQIPYSPTQKCFKLINRAYKYDSICYDTSYYDCMVITVNNEEEKILLLNDLTKFNSFPTHLLQRSYDDWIFMGGEPIGKGMILSFENKFLIRVYPSLYEQLFAYISQKQLVVHDCRYSLGSIEVLGPQAMKSLSKIFHQLDSECESLKKWFQLSLHNDANGTIPVGTSFSFSIQDPRLWNRPSNPPPSKTSSEMNFNSLITNLGSSINPSSIEKLLDPSLRNESYAEQMTIKQLSKEKAIANREVTSNKSSISLIVTKIKTSGNWCVILPWYWVLPVWIELVKVTNIKFGGLLQMHQTNFENGKPTFPTDFPFLRDGFLANEFNIQENSKKYEKKPKSHKSDSSSIEHANFHGSDWRFLQLLVYGVEILRRTKPTDMVGDGSFGSFNEGKLSLNSTVDLLLLISQAKGLDLERKARGEIIPIPICLYARLKHQKLEQLDLHPFMTFPSLPVVQIKITLIDKGNPNQNARIYKYVDERETKIENLIGFVTSATFNLNLGKGTAVGNMSAYHNKDKEKNLIHVRNIGCTVPMLARWDYV